MLKRILTMLVAAMLAVTLFPTLASATETMYVYTQNGKNLNMRYEPNTDGEIFTTVPFGRSLTVLYHLGNGWSAVSWDDNIYYVQTRFLVYTKPTKKPESEQKKAGDASTTVAELNKIFKTYKLTETPFSITVRPTRASGWVNMRFAPTKEAELMGTFRDGDQLLVIAELQDWYQVENPDTGAVGYISSKFVAK